MRKIVPFFALSFFFLLVFSCGQTRIFTKDFITKINEPTTNLKNKIRFDGVYHEATDTNAVGMYIYGAIVFFENGATYSAGSSKSLEEFQVYYPTYKDDKNDFYLWGVYNIIYDTITAIIFTPYPGGLLGGEKLYESHFQGIIKNRDSILQWHLVPPYPQVSKRAGDNVWLINNAKEPINLYFKNVPVDKIIDPKKDWIDKYRIK